MELYADPITVNCRKALAGLHLMGADFTLNKIDYFAGEHRNGFTQDGRAAIVAGQLDAQRVVGLDDDRFFVRAEVAGSHLGDVCPGFR